MSGIAESNCRFKLGRIACYHYTNTALYVRKRVPYNFNYTDFFSNNQINCCNSNLIEIRIILIVVIAPFSCPSKLKCCFNYIFSCYITGFLLWTRVRTYLFLWCLFLFHQWLYLKNLLVSAMIAATMTKTKALKIIAVQAKPTKSMVAPMINNSPISNTMRIAVIANAAKMVVKNLFIFLKF